MKNFTEQKETDTLYMLNLETPLSDHDPTEPDPIKKSFKNISTMHKNPPKILSSTSIELKKDWEIQTKPKGLEDNPIKCQLNIEMKTVAIVLITDDNDSIGKIKGDSLKIEILLKGSSIEVEGEIERLKLLDVTGYPLTSCQYPKEEDANYFELIHGGEIGKKVMKFIFKFIDDDCCIEDKIYNYISLCFEGLNFNYVQQPILRFVDFFNEKILGVLMFDYKTNEQIKNHPKRLRQIVRDPKFSDIKIKLKNSCINLVILPLLEERMKILITEISLQNMAAKNNERIVKNLQIDKRSQDFIFVDIMTLSLNDLIIYKQEQNFKDLRQISSMFDLEIEMQRIISCEDVMKFFCNISEIDDSIKIRINGNDVKLQIQKADYCHIMKILYNNLLFDDGLDQVIYHDVSIDQSNSNTEKKTCSNVYIFIGVLIV